MAEYIYRPIDHDRPSIRLLRLLRGSFSDIIQGDLFEGWINQLEGGIPYNALSYTWGTTEKSARIIVNGCIMRITSNLYAALQHLRVYNKDIILWIDDICIDQVNMQERRHQVQQMSYIYREAEQVIVWLGLGTEETDYTMDSIKRLQENFIKIEGGWRRSAQLWIHLQSRPEEANFHEYAKLRKGMELILKRPWFQRIWILQEIANARTATIHCGRKSVSARTFAQTPSIIGLQPEPHSQAVLEIMPGLRKETWWGQDRNLHTLLRKFRGSKATDKRDIVYALLGISSDVYQSDTLLPDYTKSSQQVIRDTISFLLSHTDQNQSYYIFLNWDWPEFLQHLDSLSDAVLESAVRNGYEAIMPLLFGQGADIEVKDKHDQTPLSWAAQRGLEAVVKLLLDKGANVNVTTENGETPLYWASQSGHLDTIRLLLEKGADVRTANKDGETPLYWASQNGHLDTVQLLLEQGADVSGNTQYRQTPLHWASLSGHGKIIQLLLEQGADVKAADSNGRTPLYWASANGYSDVVQLLLKYGDADVKVADSNRQTPLH